MFSGRNTTMTSFNDSYRHMKKKQKIKQEFKVAIIVLIVICIWFVAWTPYAIVSLLGIFGREDLITPFSSMVPALFCKSASCIDPYIFALTHAKFKEELRHVLGISNRNRANLSRPYSITQTKSDRIYSDDGVVEERVMIDLGKYSLHPPLRRISSTERTPRATFNQPSWWARPSFNDDCGLSKARKLVRNMSFNREIE